MSFWGPFLVILAFIFIGIFIWGTVEAAKKAVRQTKERKEQQRLLRK